MRSVAEKGPVETARDREGICRPLCRPRVLAQAAALLVASVVFCCPCSGAADEELKVEKDEEKTVYIIGPKEDKKEDKDREQSWQMLQNIIIDTRGHDGERKDNNRR